MTARHGIGKRLTPTAATYNGKGDYEQKNKLGFTLVELIVVLVILAILASLLIPALTGYVTKAKKQAVITEARDV